MRRRNVKDCRVNFLLFPFSFFLSLFLIFPSFSLISFLPFNVPFSPSFFSLTSPSPSRSFLSFLFLAFPPLLFLPSFQCPFLFLICPLPPPFTLLIASFPSFSSHSLLYFSLLPINIPFSPSSFSLTFSSPFSLLPFLPFPRIPSSTFPSFFSISLALPFSPPHSSALPYLPPYV